MNESQSFLATRQGLNMVSIKDLGRIKQSSFILLKFIFKALTDTKAPETYSQYVFVSHFFAYNVFYT